VRVVVAATADVAIPTLEWLLSSEHQLIHVVTTPDSKSGRGHSLTESPVAKWAQKKSLKVLKPSTQAETIAAFQDCDVALAVAYGKILNEVTLSTPKYGFLNLHFSLLPAYRGAAPVQRALLNGETTTGISIFKIDANLDTGPIYHQQVYEVPAMANSGKVLEDLSRIGALSFHDVLIDISSGKPPKPQNEYGISFAPKVTKDEAYIPWSNTSHQILNLIRAFNPAPVAWSRFRGETIRILEAAARTSSYVLTPRSLCAVEKRIFVGTGDSSIEILKLIPAGKKEMLVSDWLNGARLTPGEKFE
jgi:methionyl-tRNA formyltransferase